MQYIFNNLGLVEQQLEFKDGTGFESVTPWRLQGVQKGLLQVLDNNYVQLNEHSADYIQERKQKGEEPVYVQDSNVVDVCHALFETYQD